ncbi:unnamed protein product [Calypogeia fissa]
MIVSYPVPLHVISITSSSSCHINHQFLFTSESDRSSSPLAALVPEPRKRISSTEIPIGAIVPTCQYFDNFVSDRAQFRVCASGDNEQQEEEEEYEGECNRIVTTLL